MRRLAIGLLLGLAVLSTTGGPVDADPGDGDEGGVTGATVGDTGGTNGAADDAVDVAAVDVLQVSGLLDEILVSEIRAAIDRSAADGSQALVLQVNSRGTVVDDATVESLLDEVATAPVPIGLWIGPSGARLYGTGAQLVAVADVTGMAPGARIGYTGVPLSLAEADVDLGLAEEQLRAGSLGLGEARALGVFSEIPDEGVPTVTSMVQALDGYVEDGTTLVTTELVVLDDGSTRFDTVATVRFSKLSLVDQIFHTVASPPVTFLLLLAGLALLVFEFFTAGVGVAGGVGAVCLVLACTGLAVLPTRPWAAALIVFAMFAFAVDVQVGIPRFWTGVGIVATVVGSWFLFENLPGATLRPSWIALLAGLGGITLTFVVGMPSMVRTRFATPTIGREWMIGKQGRVVEAVDPEGVVEVDTALWRARTNRATPVTVGEPVVVAAIDGVTLEVEPPEGAAKDYRELRSRRPTTVDEA